MSNQIERMSPTSLNAILEYLSDEIRDATTKDELMAVLTILRELITPATLQNAVQGLGHLRADIDYGRRRTDKVVKEDGAQGPIRSVNLSVPHILSNTFEELSVRMRELQRGDPVTFANATSALTWLAQGDIKSTTN